MAHLSDLSVVAACVNYWKSEGLSEAALPWNLNTPPETLAKEMLPLLASPSVTWIPFVSVQERGLQAFIYIPAPAPNMATLVCGYMNWLNSQLTLASSDILSLRMFDAKAWGIYLNEKEFAFFQEDENGALFGKVVGEGVFTRERPLIQSQ